MASVEIRVDNMSELVNEAFIDCLFREGENHINYVRVEGITSVYDFHPERLEEKRELVKGLLAELPEPFKQGWTFLNLCENKNGEQWTGLHRRCEQLVVLAIGLDLMEYSFKRERWFMLPGGVPYVTVK